MMVIEPRMDIQDKPVLTKTANTLSVSYEEDLVVSYVCNIWNLTLK